MSGLDAAFLLGFPEISGGTNVIMEHALALTRLGHRISIVTETEIDPQRLSWKPEAMKLPLLCHNDVKDRVFDVALVTWWRTAFHIPYVAARSYAYFVQSIETRFAPAGDPVSRALAEFTYRMPMPVVTEATWIRRYLEDHYGRSAELVINGVDKGAFRPDGPALAPRPETGIRVLVEGPLGVEFKRVDLALDLCRRAGMRDVWLLTSSEATEVPGASRVLSRVPITRVGEVYRSCDVLVKLSTVEGMFGPPLEMFHCGGTAITTDVTGHEEYMRHGKNGIVVRRGHEAEVVDYLRALDRDRSFVNMLKQGAAETAAAWPDWATSAKGMERFLLKAAHHAPTPEEARAAMRVALRAGLRLARPLREAASREVTGREALVVVKRKARERIARSAPILRPILGLNGVEPKAPSPRPEPGPTPPVAHEIRLSARPRVLFVGDPMRHSWHVPPSSRRLSSSFVAVESETLRGAAGLIERIRPDITVVFEPERLLAPARELDALPGPVLGLGFSCDAQARAALAAAFPVSGRRCLLHIDSGVVAGLIEAGVRCIGPMLPPLDVRGWWNEDQVSEWAARPIAFAVIGGVSAGAREQLRELGRVPGFEVLGEPGDVSTLRSLLSQVRVSVHLPGRDLNPGSRMLRDMAMGCLVAAPRPEIDFGLMAGEHYIPFERPAELRVELERLLELPDELDVMRGVGRRRAAEFDAVDRWLEALDRPSTVADTVKA